MKAPVDLHRVAADAILASEAPTFRDIADAAAQVGASTSDLAEVVLAEQRRRHRSAAVRAVLVGALAMGALAAASMCGWALTGGLQAARPAWAEVADKCDGQLNFDRCIVSRAQESGTVALCLALSGFDQERRCIAEVAQRAEVELEPSGLPEAHLDVFWLETARRRSWRPEHDEANLTRTCEQIASPPMRDECLALTNRCDSIVAAGPRLDCYENDTDGRRCAHAKTPRALEKCSRYWSKLNSDPEACLSLPRVSAQPSCLAAMKSPPEDPEFWGAICNRMDARRQGSCINTVSAAVPDPAICVQAKLADQRDRCLDRIAREHGNPEICQRALRGRARSRCMTLVRTRR